MQTDVEGETAATTAPAQAESSRGPWLPLVHDLLAILGDVPIDSEALGLAEFRSQLETYYHRLENAASPEVAETIARECVSFCQDFQRKLQSHFSERETEVTDLVRVVEQLVATMSGQAVSIGQLSGSSDRLTRIVEIDDLRILKRRLSLELVTLRRVIDEQRQQHDEHQKKLSGEVALLQKRLDRVREEASLDGLTRIPNRARFDRTLRRWVSSHKHSGQRFVLAILDVDNFKSINDACGHPEGDRVLCEIAVALRTHVRATDLVARYGGDEFVVLLAGADLAHAEQRMRTALARIQDVKVNATSKGADAIVVSASAGLTEWTTHDSANDVVARADRALYDAKAEGKGSLKAVVRPAKSRLFENGRPVIGAPTDTTRKVG
jgi:diguanylate cyclase (GGDEF)-like protein